MKTTNTAVVGGNVTGNIGSCGITTEFLYQDSFYKQQVGVNSCTGEVVHKSDVYFDYSVVYFPGVIVFVIVVVVLILRFIFD